MYFVCNKMFNALKLKQRFNSKDETDIKRLVEMNNIIIIAVC